MALGFLAVVLGTSNFNCEIIRLAREATGQTQKQLAAKMGCTQGRLSKLEDGLLKPTEDDVRALSLHLDQPLDTFFLKGTPRSATVSFFRKAAGLPIKLLNQLEARMNLCRLRVETARRNTGLPSLPFFEPDRRHLDPRARGAVVARRIRELWEIPKGRINNVTQTLESSGVIVVHLDLGTKKLDGVSFWGETLPFIFANSTFPADRLRLTKAHELAHLLMHKQAHPDVEEEAWGFAMEFLVPKAEVASRYYPCTLDSLALLKQDYGVSMQALLKYGQDMGKINERYARYLWMQMGRFRMREPHEDAVPQETPQTEFQGSFASQTTITEIPGESADVEIFVPPSSAVNIAMGEQHTDLNPNLGSKKEKEKRMNYHVTKRKEADGWNVVREGAERKSDTAATQRQAEQIAKRLAGSSGGGEVRIHDREGKIRDSDTVPPGNDPRRSHDTKH